MTDDIEEQLAEMSAMFVQTAHEMTFDGERLTLHGLSPATLFFSDRPERVVGHLTPQQFVELWAEGENSFADDPPNAVLSFLNDAEAIEDAIFVLAEPRLEGDVVTYKIAVLEGSVPSRSSSCSLFIDPFGRPLSPVSVAGVHRRARRRALRRV
jgi:hypothetical protein